jgi:hypothetical protein
MLLKYKQIMLFVPAYYVIDVLANFLGTKRNWKKIIKWNWKKFKRNWKWNSIEIIENKIHQTKLKTKFIKWNWKQNLDKIENKIQMKLLKTKFKRN